MRELILLPGVPAAVAALNQAGLPVFVVTNQPALAKATLSAAELAEIHRAIAERLAAAGARLDGIYVCPHHPDGVVPSLAVTCDCRKPAAGLLLRAAAELDLDLGSSFMIGDGDVDVLAGAGAGATTFLIANLKPCLAELLDARGAWPDYIVPDLPAAAAAIRVLAAGPRSAAAIPRIPAGQPDTSADAYVATYLSEARATLDLIDRRAVCAIMNELLALRRRGGRLFGICVGTAARRAAQAMTDFHQLTVVEPALPAFAERFCDNGAGSSLKRWLDSGSFSRDDLLLVVCTDAPESGPQLDPEILHALQYARRADGRLCALLAGQARPAKGLFDAFLLVPTLNRTAAGRQAAEAHLLVLALLASSPQIAGRSY